MSASIVQVVRVKRRNGTTEDMPVDEAEELAIQLFDAVSATSTDSYGIKMKTAVCFGVPLRQMLSDSRIEGTVFARQVCMWLHRTLTEMSLADIGAMFPKQNGIQRDHGTVLNACRVVEARMDTDRKVRAKILALRKELSK